MRTLFELGQNNWRTAMAATIMAAAVGTVNAQDALEHPDTSTSAPGYTLFQDSTITATAGTISLTRVPVILNGNTFYDDITITFEVDSQGRVNLAPGFPNIRLSTPPITAGFKAGKYVGPATILGGQAIIMVSSPGSGSGGGTQWSLSTPTGANVDTFPASASWYAGPVANTPLVDRIKAAGISAQNQAAYSFGVGGGDNNQGSPWSLPNNLLGFIQTGNNLTIVSFSSFTTCCGPIDRADPVGQITYTLAP